MASCKVKELSQKICYVWLTVASCFMTCTMDGVAGSIQAEQSPNLNDGSICKGAYQGRRA
jgi:hypothetical protein